MTLSSQPGQLESMRLASALSARLSEGHKLLLIKLPEVLSGTPVRQRTLRKLTLRRPSCLCSVMLWIAGISS